MYCDGPLLRTPVEELAEAFRSQPVLLADGHGWPRLLLTGRQTLAGFHPLQQCDLAVANGAADLDVGRAVTPHARLGQPGKTDL